MEVGLLADTHNREELLMKAFALFEVYEVERIIHLGDMESPEYARFYWENAPRDTTLIRGNHDDEWDSFPRGKNEAGYRMECCEGPSEVVIGGVPMYLCHGDDKMSTSSIVRSGMYPVVLSAHTHRPYIRHAGETVHINPGYLRAFPWDIRDCIDPTVAVLNLDGKGLARILSLGDPYPITVMQKRLFE